MPRVAASNGVRPEIRALGVIKLDTPVTPEEINEYVGTGNYAAKYISFLNTRYGFTIEAQKQDRKVVSYILRKEPSNAKELRAAQPVAKVEKVKSDPKPRSARKVNKKFNAMPNRPKVKEKSGSNDILADQLLKELGMVNAGEVGNFSVDPGWDSMDGIDIKNLVY